MIKFAVSWKDLLVSHLGTFRVISPSTAYPVVHCLKNSCCLHKNGSTYFDFLLIAILSRTVPWSRHPCCFTLPLLKHFLDNASVGFNWCWVALIPVAESRNSEAVIRLPLGVKSFFFEQVDNKFMTSLWVTRRRLGG